MQLIKVSELEEFIMNKRTCPQCGLRLEQVSTGMPGICSFICTPCQHFFQTHSVYDPDEAVEVPDTFDFTRSEAPC